MIQLLSLLTSVAALTIAQAQTVHEPTIAKDNKVVERIQASDQQSLFPPEYRALVELNGIYQTQLQYSQLVLQRSTNRAVRQYAYNVYLQYYYSNQELNYLARTMGIPLVSIPTTGEELEGIWGQLQKYLQLSVLSGRQLDEKFISLQVETHRGALNAIETHLSSTTNEFAKQYLMRAKDTVTRHYEAAQKLQASFF